MSNLKFRVWDIGNKLMLHQLEESPCFGQFEGDNYVSIEDVFFYEKDSFKVLQFTGLTDKNGTEVYKGDILKKEFHQDLFVDFEDGMFVAVSTNRIQRINTAHSAPVYKMTQTGYSVAGNIYENPELLKEEL